MSLSDHLYCSACGEQTTATEEFTSMCCWEPLVNEAGATLTIEAILAYMDEDSAYYEEEHGRKR